MTQSTMHTYVQNNVPIFLLSLHICTQAEQSSKQKHSTEYNHILYRVQRALYYLWYHQPLSMNEKSPNISCAADSSLLNFSFTSIPTWSE